MHRSKRKLLDQLEQGRRSQRGLSLDPPEGDRQSLLRVPLSLFQERPSQHPKDSLGYFADQLGRSVGTIVKQFEAAGIPGLTASHRILPEHKDQLLNWLHAQHRPSSLYKDTSSVEAQLVVVQDITAEVLRRLTREPALLHQLAPRRFEELVARLLEQQGCEVTLTRASKDGGYDIIGRVSGGPAPVLFLAECKRYSPENKVGVEVVRSLYGVAEAQRANYGLIVTTSSFTRGAREESVRIGPRIHLREYEDVCNWLRRGTSGGA